jgi:hypothetical protein
MSIGLIALGFVMRIDDMFALDYINGCGKASNENGVLVKMT